MIYLDNAATTPMTEPVIAAMTAVMTDLFGNPSSTHAYGRQANQRLRQCRASIAQHLETKPQNILFTSGASEANNMAIKGYALANQAKGKHLITTSIEHHSVLDVMAYLAKTFGFEVTYLTPDTKGQITAQHVQAALRDDTILVSIMAANNETGLQLPIADIGQCLKHHQAVFHVDAVQVVGKIPVRPEDWQVDLLSASAHKYHGPKGIGFLYAKPLAMTPLIHGGSQENKRRAGTENLLGIVGMTEALTKAYETMPENMAHIKSLRQAFLIALDGLDYYLNDSEQQLPHIINIGFPNTPNHLLLTQLDLAGYAISAGSACTAGISQPSHVLKNLYGSNSHRLVESIRISLSHQNTLDEVISLANTLKSLIKKVT